MHYVRGIFSNPINPRITQAITCPVITWSYETPGGWKSKSTRFPGVGIAGAGNNLVSLAQLAQTGAMALDSMSPWVSLGFEWRFCVFSRKYAAAFLPSLVSYRSLVGTLHSRQT